MSARRTVPLGAFVLAVLVALALGVLAVAALAMDDGADGDGDRDIRMAAGRFAERFLTYDHEGLDDWKDEVLALSTPGFAEEVEEVEDGLRQLIGESEIDATTEVSDIFVGQEERGGVEVVIVYDRELRGSEQSRTEEDRYLQLAMIRVDEQWLVDTVIDVASATDLGPGAGGDVTPTTPAPSSTTTPESPPDG